MAGKTDTTKLQFLFKKALGFANTSNLKTDAEETAGSVWQLGAASIFAQQIPNNPSTNDSDLNAIQGGVIEYTILTASVVPGSTYNANDTGGGGSEGSQSSGPHCYSFSLNTVYQANSSNPKKGTGSFTNGMALSASNGAVQIVSTAFSTQSPNPYLLKLFEDDGSGGLGTQIFPTAEVDWYLDAYNGVLFIQDFEASTVPKFAKAFIYTGDFVSSFTGEAMAVSGSAGGKTSKILLMSGSGNSAGTIHSVSDAAYAGDPANYVDTSFYVSGSVNAISNNQAGAAVIGGDAYISGALYLAELRAGVIPGNPPDGRIAVYGKDDSGVTKIYFRNESGETEIGTGGAGAAGGSNTQVQFNNAGSLDGISSVTSDGTNVTFGDTALLVGQDIIHDGDADTKITFGDDAIGLTVGGEQLITVSEATQDIVKIGDGGDVDFQVRTLNDDNTLYVEGSTDRIGVGTDSPSTTIHISTTSPTLRLQRALNGQASTVDFAGSGAQIGASISHTELSNDLLFKTFNGSTTEEILRLGGHYGVENRQVIFLSGTDVAASDMQPAQSSDIAFFVSGSTGIKSGSIYSGDTRRGLAAFGGDVVVSGSLYVSGSVIENESTDRLTIRKTISTLASPVNSTFELDTFSVKEFFSVRYYITGKPGTSDTGPDDRFNAELLVAFDGRDSGTNAPSFAENRARVGYAPANVAFPEYLSEDNLHFIMTQSSGVAKLSMSGSYYYEQGAGPGVGLTLIINRVAYRL